MEKRSRFTVVLYGVCAVLWTIRAILDLVYQTYRYALFSVALNILCAIVWMIAFAVMLNRYRQQTKG